MNIEKEGKRRVLEATDLDRQVLLSSIAEWWHPVGFDGQKVVFPFAVIHPTELVVDAISTDGRLWLRKSIQIT